MTRALPAAGIYVYNINLANIRVYIQKIKKKKIKIKIVYIVGVRESSARREIYSGHRKTHTVRSSERKGGNE